MSIEKLDLEICYPIELELNIELYDHMEGYGNISEAFVEGKKWLMMWSATIVDKK